MTTNYFKLPVCSDKRGEKYSDVIYVLPQCYALAAERTVAHHRVCCQ